MDEELLVSLEYWATQRGVPKLDQMANEATLLKLLTDVDESFFSEEALVSTSTDCWVVRLRNLVQISVMLCEYSKVVKANFNVFGSLDFIVLSSDPHREDYGRVVALLLLASVSSAKSQMFIQQILKFPEEHQVNLQQVLKYALSDEKNDEKAADLVIIKNLLMVADNFIEALSELADVNESTNELQEKLDTQEIKSRDNEEFIEVLKLLPSNLQNELSQKDNRIAALRAELEEQEKEFQEIMLEFKEDLDYKDELLKEYQEERDQSETLAAKARECEKLTQKLEEARTLNASLHEELKAREAEKEAGAKLKSLLDFLNAQFAKEKQASEQLKFELAHLHELLDASYVKNENLQAENKQMYDNTRVDHRRVKHLSQQLEKLSTKSDIFDDVSKDEGEGLNVLTIELNKQMEEDIANYQAHIRTLEKQMYKQGQKVQKLRFKLKQSMNESEALNKVISLTSENDDLRTENIGLKALIEKSGPKSNIGKISRLPSMERIPFRILSAEIFASASKNTRVDETEMLRERIKTQDESISQLLCLKQSLLVSLEQLSDANTVLSSKVEGLEENMQETTAKLTEAIREKKVLAGQFDRELKFMSSILADVEHEVIGIRTRFATN
mmetsp:Transcript_20124/g.37417  ORF Transcript_20124/g.37417 Transcript_20124/m.37417 type:complete len:617 (+) Transcript_20124:130-1980(+)